MTSAPDAVRAGEFRATVWRDHLTGESSRPSAWRARAGLLAVCALALFTASAGITDEGHVSLQGDMPRYLMNGVFVHDLLQDLPLSSVHAPLEYAQLYYARYPALSLGHHPPLLAPLEALSYAAFGISVRSARLVEIAAFTAAAAFLYLIVESMFGWPAGAFAAALLATSPFLTQLARSVLSEVPALALLLAAAFYLHRFCSTQKRSDLVAFVAAATLSLYAKQLAFFAFPAFVAMIVLTMGVRRLFRRDLVLAGATIAVLTVPLGVMTVSLSPMNVAVTAAAPGARVTLATLVRAAFMPQFAAVALAAAALGAIVGVVRRDSRVLLFLVWTIGVFGCMRFAAPWEPARYSVYLAPAVCGLAASLVSASTGRALRAAVALVLAAAIVLQIRQAAAHDVAGARGYEEAAQFVLASSPGPTVLFSGDVDTGFFTFFIRKHDRERRLVVLRADKLLTTSLMGRPAIADRIGSPEDIYTQLQTFGTRYIVVEDRPSASRVLRWLQQELRTPRFAERRRIRIDSRDTRLRGVDLVVYEYLDARPAHPNAVLSMNLPLVGRSVAVPLADLIHRKYFD